MAHPAALQAAGAGCLTFGKRVTGTRLLLTPALRSWWGSTHQAISLHPHHTNSHVQHSSSSMPRILPPPSHVLSITSVAHGSCHIQHCKYPFILADVSLIPQTSTLYPRVQQGSILSLHCILIVEEHHPFGASYTCLYPAKRLICPH